MTVKKNSVFTWLIVAMVIGALVNSAVMSWHLNRTHTLSQKATSSSRQNLLFSCAAQKFAAHTVAADTAALKSEGDVVFGVPRAVYKLTAQRNIEFLEVFKVLDCSSVSK